MSLSPEQRAGFFTAQYNKDNDSFGGKGQAGLLTIVKDAGSLRLGIPLCKLLYFFNYYYYFKYSCILL